ncbi:MAG: response regulator, partial [Pseudomonadota bacterium]
DWDGASLVELLRTEATAFLQDGAARIRVEGADAVLKPQAFSTVALVMHEMITNAAKYGALRDRNGGVDIRLEETVEGALRIDWREWGGPPVRPPTREGFGSTIVERSIPYELAGEAEVEHKISGVRARFRIPPSQILEFADLPEARRACGGEAVPSSIKGTVLVVEDMLLLAMGAERYLKILGADEVVVASSCQEALAAVKERSIDLALLDVHLDQETSAPVARVLIEAGIPFLVATGYGTADVGIEEFDGVPVISKPFGVEDIAESVSRLSLR